MEDDEKARRFDDTLAGKSQTRAFAIAVGLLAIALVGAISTGVLGTVGPYLVGVSVLVAALFVLGRR